MRIVSLWPFLDARNTEKRRNKCPCGDYLKFWRSSSSASLFVIFFGEIRLIRKFTFPSSKKDQLFLSVLKFSLVLVSWFDARTTRFAVICVCRRLDLSPYLSINGSEHGAVYDLFAVVNHFGGILYGHYTAFARCPAASSDKSQEDIVGKHKPDWINVEHVEFTR